MQDSEIAREVDSLLKRAEAIMEPMMYRRRSERIRHDSLDWQLADWLKDYMLLKGRIRLGTTTR